MPVVKTGLVLWTLLLCFFVNASPNDSAATMVCKPIFSSAGRCINTDLLIEAISPKVERIDWKCNDQLVHTSLTPALVKTVAGVGEGTCDDEFRFPSGIAVDGAGNIYVADQFNHRVQKWTPGVTKGITVAGIAGQGDGADQLNYPMAVAVDTKGNLYVSDAANSRIQMFTPGSFIGVTVAGGNGRGKGAAQFNMPFGICLDEAGNIYVADNYNHRIQRWAPGATTGVTIAGGNGKGNAANQLQYPASIKINQTGTLFIADAANDRVQAWKKGAETGITVAGGKGRGIGADQLHFPTDIVLNAAGDLFITDQTNQRIQCWKQGAKTGTTVAGGMGMGADMNQFNFPYGLAIDANDNIYVADQYNHRIQFIQNPESNISYSFSLKASRPGKYYASIVYRNGETELSDPIEIHALPAIAPIQVAALICSGKQYQLTVDARDGKWTTNNSAIAEINANGLLEGKQHGTAVITYEIRNEFGCVNSVSKTIEVKKSPVVPPITLAPTMKLQTNIASLGAEQLCVGSSLSLTTMLMQGIWNSSDTNIAKVEGGKIRGIGEGEVVISYTVEENGCVAENSSAFVVLAAAKTPVIQGYNKVVTGYTGQLSVGAIRGIWSSELQHIATVDHHGYIKAISPGTTKIRFETNDEKGCKAIASIPVSILPEAPMVKDASYANDVRTAYIRFDQQVTAKAGTSLVFYESASPNAASIEPLAKMVPGSYRFWVSSVQNGVLSQRVAFAVYITESGSGQKLEPVIMGNPSTNFFTVRLKSAQPNLPIAMRIMDLQGRLIEQRQSVMPNSTLQFGHAYAAGQYVVEWIQGTERKVVQLVKIGEGSKAVNLKSQLAILQ